jgi:hypothetical protein
MRVALFTIVPLAVAAIALAILREDSNCDEKLRPGQWQSAAAESKRLERLADRIDVCHQLDGATKPEVRRLLGPARRDELQTRDEYRYEWLYFVGTANDYMGPGDAQYLYVSFTHSGEVSSAELEPR